MLKYKILITGVSGFIGESLAKYYNDKGLEVIGLVRDRQVDRGKITILKSDYSVEQIRETIERYKPDIVIHAAGSASVHDSLHRPHNDFKNTVLLFHNVLEGIRQSKHLCRMVYLSSAAVYGNPETFPVQETDSLKPISPYGYHKMLCELLAQEYSDCFNVPTFVVRLFSVFGPGQKRLLIWELYNQFMNNQEVVIKGTGNESRDYIYIDDLAENLFQLIMKEQQNHYLVINLASEKAVIISEIVNKMKKILNSKKGIIFKNQIHKGNPSNWEADISLYKNLISFEQSSSFESRLEECLAFWREENKKKRIKICQQKGL